MTIREGKWKCTYCDMLNRGRDLKCTGCGAVREQDVQFIYDENAPEITDQGELASARRGPDWICETCGVSNLSTAEGCRQCGAPRGGSVNREVGLVPPPEAQSMMPEPPATSGKSWMVKGLLGCGGLVAVVVILFLGLGIYLTRTHEVPLTVTGVNWERTTEVEQLQTLTEESWVGEVPSDARELSRRREFHHNEKVKTGTRTVTKTYTEKVKVGTKRVKTGTKDLGNGYFEDVYKDEPVYENRTKTRTEEDPVYRDEPVYKDKVRYQVDRWRTIRTDRTEGADTAPYWPKIPEEAKIREGKKTEKYVVQLKDPKSGKAYQQEVPLTDFPRFRVGSTSRAIINNAGTIKQLPPPAE